MPPIVPTSGRFPSIPAGVGVSAVPFTPEADMITIGAKQLVSPSTQTASLTGSAVDFTTPSAACYAVQQVGIFEETATWTAKLQESTDGATGWTDVAGGAFAVLTEGSQTEILRFMRTKRYLRYVAVAGGSGVDLSLAVVAGDVVVS